MLTDTMKQDKRGFTVAELAISLAITAVIAAAVAGMAMAVSTASEHGRDRYLSLQTARIAMLNVQEMLRKAKLVLAADSRGILLWAEDANGDTKINRSEVVLIGWNWYDHAIRTSRIVFPEEWSDEMKASLDTELQLDGLTSVQGASYLLVGDPYEQMTVLATDVTGVSITVLPQPPMTDLVGLSMTVGSPRRTVTLRSAVHLRAEETDRVGMVYGKYVLMDPGGGQWGGR